MKTKIFVTTGSVLEFDELIKQLDKINLNKQYNITAQIGKGKYIPKHLNYFKYSKDLNKYFDWADIVITHTGAGTLFELLEKNKKIICISNPKATDNHELAEKLDKNKYLLFVDWNNKDELKNNIIKIINNKFKFKSYKNTKSTIGSEIIKYIKLKNL